MNYIDLIILVAAALCMYMGYRRGFIRDFADLVALAVALVLAYFTYKSVSPTLTGLFSLATNLSEIVAFFLVWFVVMFVYYGLMTFFYDCIPGAILSSKYNKWFGLVPALIQVVFFVWFTVNLLYLLLASGPVRQAIDGSYISRNLVRSNSTINSFLDKTFGATAADTVKFLTVRPQSSESIALGFTTTSVTVDKTAAQEMLTLVNNARKENGEKELVFDEKLAAVGEAHCVDMFARGYFSHNTSDGKTPFDRMNAAGINYLLAGENLALAPTVQDAFNGLIASSGHKANMLSGGFGRIGISVIDGGVHGLMIAQEFTN